MVKKKYRNPLLRSLIYTCLVSSFLFCISSCVSKEPKNIRIFDADGEAWQSKESFHLAGNTNYKVAEVPTGYFIKKHLKIDSKEKIDSIAESFKQERILIMEFHDLEEKDILTKTFKGDNYEEAVKYMAFDIRNDYQLITSSQDTIPCVGLNFERNFNVAPFKRILLHFGNVDPNDTVQLVYEDHLLGNGTLTFDFNERPIKL